MFYTASFHKSRFYLAVGILFMGISTGCSFFSKKEATSGLILASVHDTHLYEEDIKGLIPAGTAPEDSVELVRNYVQNWILETLMLQKAELNLSEDLKNVEQQLEAYRKSLIIYTYQERLIRQLLDTLVTDEEIKAYYQQNPENFELRQNIVKVKYLIFSAANKDRLKVKNWFLSNKPDASDKLLEFCRKSAFKYSFNDSAWMFMDALEKEIPFSYPSQEALLASRNFVEVEDSALVYFVKFTDYKIKESLSPLEFERDRIKSIILNIRKLDILRKVEDDLFKEAIDNEYIQNYVDKN